jgi:fucose permease
MRKSFGLLALSVAAFVVLGMPKSALGVAWPSAAGDFDRSVGDLGLVITVYVVGYFLAAMVTGLLISRFSVGSLLTMAAGLATVSLVGYSTVLGWPLFLVAVVGLGLAGGLIDAGVNAVVAVHHGARAMGMLHAGFGIGATLGPLMMTTLIETDSSWRIGFVAMAVAQGLLALLYLRTRTEWNVEPSRPDPSTTIRPDRKGALWGALVVFALYSGVEVGTGQWAYTLLTEGRGVSTAAAGGAVTAFWAALTVSRLGLGVVGHRVRVLRLLGGSSLLVLAGAGALWHNPVEWVGLAGLVIMGLALGPIFPLQTTLTPSRVGVAYTPTAIGFQLAAATVGAAAIPGGLGLAVSRAGLEVVGTVLVVTAVLLVGSIEVLRRIGPAEAQNRASSR